MEHIAHPGILVECGFLSNPDEERRLATPAHQKKIAATLAAVLAGFVHSGI
jgi:N-acetylmuramoyl-L-alanine amidase